MTDEQGRQSYQQVMALQAEMKSAGAWVFGDPATGSPPPLATVPEEAGPVEDDRLRLIFTCCFYMMGDNRAISLTSAASEAVTPGPHTPIRRRLSFRNSPSPQADTRWSRIDQELSHNPSLASG